MTSGVRRLIYSLLFLSASALQAQSKDVQPAQAHSEPLLKSVMTQLAQVKSANSTFTEKRYLKLTKDPIELSGTLTYTAPDTFEKRTLKPIEDRMTVERHLVTIQSQKKRPQQIMIDQQPALAAIVDAFRGALSGNSAALKQSFNLTMSGASNRWSLKLVPQDTKQLGYVRSIRVSGNEDEINEIEVLQADGDRSVMNLSRK
jgi:outer membrane lipoprotein-sorting protein